MVEARLRERKGDASDADVEIGRRVAGMWEASRLPTVLRIQAIIETGGERSRSVEAGLRVLEAHGLA